MALVEHQGGRTASIAAAVTGILYRYGRQLNEDQLEGLRDAVVNAIQEHGTAAAQWVGDYVREWANHAYNEGSSEITRLVNSVTQQVQVGIERGGSLYESLGSTGTMIEYSPGIDGTIQNTGGATVGSTRDRSGNQITDNSGRQQIQARDRARLDTRNNEMQANGGQQSGQEAARAPSGALASGGGNNPQSKETPISNYPSISYGLQETHTTILPWTGWVSAAQLSKGLPAQLRLRMNSPYDMFLDGLLGSPNYGQAFANGTGLYAVTVGTNGLRGAYGSNFPATMGNNSSERPAWREYWSTIYEWYTVLGCEYKITIENPVANLGGRVICGVQFDSSSTTAGSTGNVMPQTLFKDTLAFKNIEWHVINENRSETNNENITIIQGRYMPGMIKRNIQNDGDVKTWTNTDPSYAGTPSGSIPTLRDVLTLNFWRHPLAYSLDNENGGPGTPPATANQTGVNIQMELKYIVQYKDLKEQARYPSATNTTQVLSQILNSGRNTAGQGLALQKWDTADTNGYPPPPLT